MQFLRTLYKYIKFYGGAYRCIICDRPVRRFYQFSRSLQQAAESNGFPYSFRRMETLNYDNCNCPFCLSSDRERLYIIFLEKYFAEHRSNHTMLDFAPTLAFAARLRNRPGLKYTSADLDRKDVDINVDVCHMTSIAGKCFDIIICSHILEHVSDPVKAVHELSRILADDGIAIVMVPLFWDVEATVDDSSFTTAPLRLKHFGQDDHVRLYAKDDFLSQLKTSFAVDQLTPGSFNQELINKNAIAANSVLYVCKKLKKQVV